MNLDWLTVSPADYRPLRGSDRIDKSDALAYALLYDDRPAYVLGVPVPRQLLERGVVLQGGQGSGKTLTIKSDLVRLMPGLATPGNRKRIIVLDPKGDLTPFILSLRRGVCPNAPLYLVNPFDRFGHALDPHEFARHPTRINQLVHSLAHKRDGRSDEFFDNSARSHLVDLVKVLRRRVPGKWDWRTFLLIATDPELLEEVLACSRIGARKAKAIVKKTFHGIVSTNSSWLDPYEAAIACWHRSPTFSLEEFLRGSGILILTTPADQIESLTPIARMLLRMATERLLADTGRDPGSQTTLVLDEFSDLEHCVKAIAPMFGRSRAARVSVLCAWQSWPMVCASHGEQLMKGVVDNAAVRVWMIAGPDSTEVAAKSCGTIEVRQRDESFTTAEKSSSTTSYKTASRQNVLPSEFMALRPPAPRAVQVRAYMTASHLPGPIYCEHDYQPLVDLIKRLEGNGPKAVRERNDDDLWLPPWDDADGERLWELFEQER